MLFLLFGIEIDRHAFAAVCAEGKRALSRFAGRADVYSAHACPEYDRILADQLYAVALGRHER